MTLNRFQPEGNDALAVSLDDVPFGVLVGWLEALASEEGIAVRQASIDARDEPGAFACAWYCIENSIAGHSPHAPRPTPELRSVLDGAESTRRAATAHRSIRQPRPPRKAGPLLRATPAMERVTKLDEVEYGSHRRTFGHGKPPHLERPEQGEAPWTSNSARHRKKS